ncbi:hypothetical protein IMZ29_18585 [Achromobacter sp. GG226]|uniref:hypothetical protein n=1 Tax=Verticiella alkaliphila TaxID=2779529 RepID=UPI001C0C9A46|nr:hypothetical protein [Verticiella sp. GG226]MBU4612478.1 hypothetical protein [Verticiella sp. GG226]
MVSYSLPSWASSHTWSSASRDHDIESIKLTNGLHLVKTPGTDGSIYGSKIVVGKNAKDRKVLLDNDVLSIDAAFPNQANAAVAIISESCSGSACVATPTYMVIPKEKFVEVYEIADADFEIDVILNQGQFQNAVVKNVAVGVDEYGSDVKGELRFISGKGFVLDEMKPLYEPLLGAYLYDYFEHKVVRQPLFELVGSEQFIAMRKGLAVNTPAKLIDYRYLSFYGCMAHNCSSVYGIVIVDTITDDVWWLVVNGDSYTSGESRKAINLDKINIDNMLRKVEFSETVRLYIDHQGGIAATTR